MKRLEVLIAALVALLASGTAEAQCTLPTATSFNEETVVGIGDASACTGQQADSGALVNRVIAVSGQPTFLTDINVRLNVTHVCPGDLQITLTSPQGTVVSVVTNLGGDDAGFPHCFAGSSGNILAGTTFDDAADPAGSVPYDFNNLLATDISPAFNTVATILVPEEPLAAFFGENPNGNWTLRLVDTCNGDTGSLNSWGLDIAALPSTPVGAANTFPGTGGAIPNPGVLISSIDVDGLPTFVTDVDVFTSINHTSNGQLQIALRSPSGRVATMSSANGGVLDDVFLGTLWDDQADPGGNVPHLIVGGNQGVPSDHQYNVGAPLLSPEEGFGSFYGEDPNGTWTLIVADRFTPDTGTLNNWNLVITTGTCPTPTPTSTGTVTPTSTPTPTLTVTPGGPTVTPVAPTNTPGPSPTPTPTLEPKICNGLPSTIVGTSGNDLIIGTDTDDVIHGKGGNDEVKGRGGADILCGGSGNDVVRGGGDADFLKGGSGNDFLKGGGDRDVILGNKGDDVINGGKDDDTCIDDNGSNSFANCEDIDD